MQAQEQGDKQVADALRPYGQFAHAPAGAQAADQPRSSPSRFDWERALRQLSRAIPEQRLAAEPSPATVSPDVEVEAAAAAATSRTCATKAHAPAFTITGCTYSQHAVARMMTRMQQPRRRHRRPAREVRAQGRGGHRRRHRRGAAPRRGGAAQDSQDCVGSDARHQVRHAGRVRRRADGARPRPPPPASRGPRGATRRTGRGARAARRSAAPAQRAARRPARR